jgi:hypothetical protein
MTRIPAVTKENASPKVQELFTAVQKAMGTVPNLVSTLAQSPAAAQA